MFFSLCGDGDAEWDLGKKGMTPSFHLMLHIFFFKFLGSCFDERLQAMESNKIVEHM